MKAILERLGFQVEILTNATLRQMTDAVDRFARRLFMCDAQQTPRA
jgi:hypothetical protein